ncbi:MAG: ROK family protein [Verrucomicrobia bacterium]|nr:ROK family protein [Verrucomicrobiota bacterium]
MIAAPDPHRLAARASGAKRILVADIGGSHVKVMISASERRKFPSGPRMTPRKFTAALRDNVKNWNFDALAIGFPAPVHNGRILAEPKNLGGGWRGFDFRKALSKPARVVNDAALQALGSYRGGRMLFLGLGTGVGSALIYDRTVLSLELGDLPYLEGKSFETRFGDQGLRKLGKQRWVDMIGPVLQQMRIAFIADYVVLGGGNAKLIPRLPEGIEPGHNRNVFRGGQRLWETDAKTRRAKWTIF